MPASVEVSSAALPKSKATVIAIGATATPKGKRKTTPPPALGPGGAELAAASGADLASELAALGFDGSVGSVARIPLRGDTTADTLLVVGLGTAADLTADAVRKAGAAVADNTTSAAHVAAAVSAAATGLDGADAAQAFVEGFRLGAYRYNEYKRDGDVHATSTLTVQAAGDHGAAAVKRGAAAGSTIADGVTLVRDLVNAPPGAKRPPAFADRAKALCKGTGIRVKILDVAALEKGGYGGLLGVGQGSSEGPRLVELTYDPKGAKGHIALVGKGITFDSGGLSLKPSASMETMKMDMAGAATVLATVLAAAELGVKTKITGLLALAENMPSGTAIRPSDVLTIRGGTTVEVLNTDAEGRLVLADALVHASEAKPDLIVDMATLTGAVSVALGRKIGAVMATDDDLADALLAASKTASEPMWRLPLPHDLYGEELKGDVGDLKNAGWKDAGTIRAGLFLNEFVAEGIPWAHLDIAGIAWTDGNAGYLRKGATGAPLRTLVAWLRSR